MHDTIRCFIAIDLTESARQYYTHAQNILKKRSNAHTIGWTKPENLHLTLGFIAQLAKSDIDNLIKSLTQYVSNVKTFTMVLRNIEVFPNNHRPYALAIAVAKHEELIMLREKVQQAMRSNAYPIDMRLFRPHITLGRIKGNRYPDLSSLPEEPQTIPVDTIILYKSQGDNSGSNYTLLKSIPLQTQTE